MPEPLPARRRLSRPTPTERTPTPTPLPAGGSLALLPRESLERTARLLGVALRSRAAVLGTGHEALPDARDATGTAACAASLCVALVPAPGIGEPIFCADAERSPAAGIVPAARYFGARAYAVLPLPSAASADPTDPDLALCVLAEHTRLWSEDEGRALTDIAATLGAELAALRELAEARGHEQELREHALRDSLTGLPNRALFLERLSHAVVRARRHKDFRFAVLLLDLDRFKAVNDSLGPAIGDEVLVAVADRLIPCVRGEDMVARLSGDEYAILLESISDDSDGGRVAERIQRALAAPIATAEGDVFPVASIGITLSGLGLDADDAPIRLLQQAGVAMSRAKAAGRGRYEMYDGASQARARARLRMETDLRRALERSEFRLFYQPLITLGTGRICELEALLRWEHPERGIVPPLDFIPLAEETGLIVPIGNWVLGEACRQTKEWQGRFTRTSGPPLSLSVNLSVKQLSRPGFARQVAETIGASGIDPSSVKLEITESFAIEDPDGTRALLEELRRFGVRIYLDDFGTGYSSLGYLHRLPLDAIKIDRSFVGMMDRAPTHRQLVNTVRELARNIGVQAVAEGVETVAQLQLLRELGCEAAQGFLFSRPVPVPEIERLLAEDPRW